MSINFNNTKKSSSNENLANFNLEVYSRARQVQNMRSGLLSNSGALRNATFEHFSKDLIAINCALDHARLFDRETKEEQIQPMKEHALTSSGSTKEASDIVESMLDRFSTGYQTRNKPSITVPASSIEHKDDSDCNQSDCTPQNDGASTNYKTDKETCCTP